MFALQKNSVTEQDEGLFAILLQGPTQSSNLAVHATGQLLVLCYLQWTCNFYLGSYGSAGLSDKGLPGPVGVWGTKTPES